MSVKTLAKAGLVLFILLSLLDLCLTWLLIRYSGGKVEEGNPIAKAWLVRWGWEGMVVFKMGAMSIVATVIVLLTRHRPLVGVLVATFACLALGLVTYYSYGLLMKFFP